MACPTLPEGPISPPSRASATAGGATAGSAGAAGSASRGAAVDQPPPFAGQAQADRARRQGGRHWINTPVLLEAIERLEQGRLPRSLALWLAELLELEAPPSAPLRRHDG